jgi:hypothetical protein
MADAEWSLQLMRCELSQCVREGLINLLQGAGLWTSDVQLRAVLAESRTRGADLQQQLVAPALGSADHAYLIAEKAFGIPRHGLRKSIPLSLSFGYYLGAGIHDYLGLDAASRDGAARLCALFNLLTVIFDRTCDDFNRGVTELSRCFGEANMLALADHPRGSHELAEAAGAVPVPEIRILLKIISAFYLQAGHYAQGGCDKSAWHRLNDKLLAAYRAEIQSVLGEAPTQKTAADKGLLLFNVMLGIVQLRGDGREGRVVQMFVDQLGSVFWLLDDLVDLVRDVGTRHVNGIVCQLQAAHPLDAQADEAQLLRLLLHKRVFIDQALDRLASQLTALMAELAAAEPLWPRAGKFRELILAYLRGACE